MNFFETFRKNFQIIVLKKNPGISGNIFRQFLVISGSRPRIVSTPVFLKLTFTVSFSFESACTYF